MRSAEKMSHKLLIGWLPAVAVLVVAILTGCAEKGPILLNIEYQEPEEKAGASSTATVGVSPFQDVRGKSATVLGKRTIPNGQENDLVVQGTVAELATSILKKALSSRGISVKDVPAWDFSAEGMRDGGSALQLGGEIKTLWLESTAEPWKTHLLATILIKVVAGDPSEKKIIRTVVVSSKIDQGVLYSQEELESALSEALSSAMDQIFQDEELKKRLH
jgi:uncharacterized lipoprotein YajG